MSASDDPLARYAAALRRQRFVYFGVVGAVVVALVATVAVAWARGEVAHTTLHTTSSPPPAVATAVPTASVRRIWHTADQAAIGDPRYRGTVVVHDTHTVRGVDARTGRTTWSYTRSNRTVCAAVQKPAVTGAPARTIAVYRVKGDCDEVTALDPNTGKRQWTRTLDLDGKPVNGTAGYQVLPTTILVTTSSVVYAIDPTTGYNRWIYTRFGCTIHGVALGGEGVLISQTCAAPRCADQKFCARGPQLLLRDPTNDVDTNGKDNPDRILWNLIGNTDVPVSADAVITALNTTTRALDLLNPANGKDVGSIPLSPVPSATGAISTTTAGGGTELVTVRGVAAAVGGSVDRPIWSRAVSGALTAEAPADPLDLTLAAVRITVPTTSGADVLDGSNGAVRYQVTLNPRPPAGSSVFPLGSGQLTIGPTGTAAYR